MDERLVFNQQVRILWNSEPSGPVATLANPFSGNLIEVDDVSILNLCEYANTSRTQVDLVEHLAKESKLSKEESKSLVGTLTKSGVFVSVDKNLWANWDEYHWREAAFFHFLSRNQMFLDDAPRESADAVRHSTLEKYLAESGPPEFFKKLPVDYRSLCAPKKVEGTDFFETLMDRRTIRKYNGKATDEQVLASVLHDATARARALRLEIESSYKDNPDVLLKSWGSAFEVYVGVHRANGIEPGFYHYDMRDHGLGPVVLGDVEDVVYNAIWGQPMATKTCFTIFLTARFERYMWRYRYDRGLRNLLTNMGELAQIFILAGIARGLGNSMTPALRDSALDAKLGLDPTTEQALYFLGFGHYGGLE